MYQPAVGEDDNGYTGDAIGIYFPRLIYIDEVLFDLLADVSIEERPYFDMRRFPRIDRHGRWVYRNLRNGCCERQHAIRIGVRRLIG